MYMFVDESGSFKQADHIGSWCVVGGYAIAEHQRAPCLEALRRYKLRAKRSFNEEVKRGNVDDSVYFRFLEDIAEIGGLAIAVTTDAGLYQNVKADQDEQVRLIRESIDQRPPEAQRVTVDLADAIEGLSEQLFVEINCRLMMAWRVIKLATKHFVRSRPATLSAFRWRMDRKDVTPTLAEKAYGPMLAGIASKLSEREEYRLNLWGDADYRHMDKFRKNPALAPTATGRWYDASSLCLDGLELVDSKADGGVQIADVIVSGIRNCLRGGFEDNERAARLLGSLMVLDDLHDQAVHVILFGARDGVQATPEATQAILRMTEAARVLA